MRVPTSTSVSLHTTRRMRCELPLDWFFHRQGRLEVADVVEAKHDDDERLEQCEGRDDREGYPEN
jgi:hypothetical protein